MMGARYWVGLALAASALIARGAAAHGAPPQITQVMLDPPERAVVATSRGILFGDPHAHRWSLVCKQMLGIDAGLGYRIATLPSGRLFVASLTGMQRSDDQGCSWARHPTLGKSELTYLFQQPGQPERMLVAVFGEQGGVQGSDDGGETFRALYRAGNDEFVNTVLAAPGDPQRLYASLSTTEEVARLFVLRSRDGGVTWQRSEVRLHDDPLDVSLLAVNPTNPNQLLLRVRATTNWNQDGLLYSADGGATFTEVGSFARIADGAFSADGATSFVVASDALLRSSVPPTAFSRVEAQDRLTYGQVFGGELLMGGYNAIDGKLVVNMWSAQVSNPGAALSRWMSFADVTSMQTCPATSTLQAKCVVDWLDWSQEFLSPEAP